MSLYSSKYDTCFAKTLEREGGVANDPNDAGGFTNMGISLRFLQRLVDIKANGYQEGDMNMDGEINEEDIAKLTVADVKRLLYEHFWLKFSPDIEDWDTRVAWKIFDMAVNASPTTSAKILQKSIGAFPDGVIGPQTRTFIRFTSPDTLVARFAVNQCLYYARISEARPRNSVFLIGWIKRAAELGEELI